MGANWYSEYIIICTKSIFILFGFLKEDFCMLYIFLERFIDRRNWKNCKKIVKKMYLIVYEYNFVAVYISLKHLTFWKNICLKKTLANMINGIIEPVIWAQAGERSQLFLHIIFCFILMMAPIMRMLICFSYADNSSIIRIC